MIAPDSLTEPPWPPDAPVEPSMHRGWLWLGEDGFRYAAFLRPKRPEGARFYRYQDLTHLSCSPRGLWVGTREEAMMLRRSHFASTEAPEQLLGWLTRRIGSAPDGARQLDRMLELERRSDAAAPRWATSTLIFICILVMVLQLLDPFVGEIGSFAPELVARGEWWRVLSSNVLHSVNLFPFHIVSNLVLIFCFGMLVERPLGTARTVVILGVSGLAAMAASSWAGYEEVIGASGLAAGLVGAVLCLELRFSQWLPVNWRLPRRLFVGVLIFQAAIDWMLPQVAMAAHLGGFVAGYCATLYLAESGLRQLPVEGPVRFLATLTIAGFALSLLAPLPLLLREGAAMERHAEVLLESWGQPTTRYNDHAWRIVTETRPSPRQLELALALAERAVFETDRSNPDVLDTLAEVFFVAGYPQVAVEVIDEALRIAGEDRYFQEQRLRFLGERPADDRPAPPRAPWIYRQPERSPDTDPRGENWGSGLEI